MPQIQISLLLDRARADTLTEQVAAQLRDAIRFGRIPVGARLPSSRRLSDQLAIGRNTVVRAYETLELERYVEARPASGIFAALPPEESRIAARPAPRQAPRPPRMATETTRLAFDFAPDRPDAALFPIKALRRTLQSCLAQGGALGLTQAPDLCGLAALRAAIANHIAAARGIVAEPGQVIIVNGTTAALAIAARLAVTPGALVALENPCAQPTAAALRAAGATLHAVPVDLDGIVVDELPSRPPALIAITPSHQYPTGCTLPESRREAVAAYAHRAGSLILEDDRGADLRYEGGLPPAVAALAPDRTIYLNSFSQIFGAGLCLGYLVVPPALIEAARSAKAMLDQGSPWLEQAAVAELMRTGTIATHLMRMRVEYRQRRDALLDALNRNFGAVEVSGEAGGMHLYWHLPPGVPDAAVIEALGRRARVGVYAPTPERVHALDPGGAPRRGLMLGYACLSPSRIGHGIAHLSDAIDDALDRHHIAPSDLLAEGPMPMPRRVQRRQSAKPAPRNRQQPALPGGPTALPSSRQFSEPRRQMHATQPPIVTALYQYPVKGLSPQGLPSVRVAAGQPFPFDRIFALARPGTAVTPEAPNWAKKGLFVMLMLDEGLATVRTRLDPDSLVLTAHAGAEEVLRTDLSSDAGREEAERFFHRLAPSLRAAPVLVRSPQGHFMDKPDSVISLINLATLRALEDRWGVAVDPLRFRANIYVDGVEPWAEFDWVGADIRIGSAVFRVDRRNGRCGATNVNPATGQRDLDIPGSLRKAYGHKDVGVYLVARNDAELAVGDVLMPPFQPTDRLAPLVPVAPASAHSSFICRGCYYIYDEAEGVPAAGVPPGTRFAALPAAWRCPDCGTDAATFRPYTPPP